MGPAMGIPPVVWTSRRAELWGANAVLLVAGATSIVVAVVGLFVRASPTLSGFFLVVGAVLLVASVFAPFVNQSERRTDTVELDLALLERSARIAEKDITRGELLYLQDTRGNDDSASPPGRTFMANAAAKMLRHSDDETVSALTQELQNLPKLEETSRMAPIEGPAAGYRSLTLPSGYMAVYRRMTPVEIKQATGEYADEDAYLVADLVPLIHPHDETRLHDPPVAP